MSSLYQRFEFCQGVHPFGAYIAACVLQHDKKYSDLVSSFLADATFKYCGLMQLIEKKQAWQLQLKQLSDLLLADKKSVAKSQKRLVWLLNVKNKCLVPQEQKKTKQGGWSKGRNVALKRLAKKDSTLDYLTDQDWAAAKGIKAYYSGWYGSSDGNYEISKAIALPALVGHPYIFRADSPDVPIELVRGEMELSIEECEQGYRLGLSEYATENSVVLQQESLHRYKMIALNDHAIKLCQMIGKEGLTVPADAKEAVLQIVQNANAPIKIHADIEGTELPVVLACSDPLMQLIPVADGLKLSLWTRPFKDQGPYCQAGRGKDVVMTLLKTAKGEARVRTERDLKAEKNNLKQFLTACPTLSLCSTDDHEWYLEEPETCLEVLSELEQYQ